jgi:hypothetical protein
MLAAVWEVTEVVPRGSFVWRARSGGLSWVAGHTIDPAADSVTVRLTLELTGPLSALVGRLFGARIRTYLGAEAEGLKTHCEA